MGRDYWLPSGYENLIASEGLYVKSEVVYGEDINKGWEQFLTNISLRLQEKEHSFQGLFEWRSSDMGQSRFVMLHNSNSEIIVEDTGRYVAVYVIIPEECANPLAAKRVFPRYCALLKKTLTELYPNAVYRLIDSRHIEKVH